MWEDNTLPFLDYGFLNSPEFQQQIQDAVAQYEQPSLLPVSQPAPMQSGGADVEALKALGLSDQDVAQIVNFDPSQLNMGLLGSIGGLGVGGGVYNGEYKAFDAPLSNKGNPTSKMGDNQIFVAPESQVRLVNQATGETVTQGVGYDAAQEAIDKAKQLTESGGNKANWQIQVAAPGEGTFSIAANEKENKNVIGKIADVALPVLASALIPGGGLLGTILPAAGGSAISSVAQGRDLGETLLRSALVGGTAGLGEKFLAPAISQALSPAAQAGTQAATEAVAQAGTQALAQTAAQEAAPIVVNAILPSVLSKGISSGISSLASNLLPSVFDSAQLSNVAPAQSQPATTPVTYTQPPEEIIATAIRQPASTAVSDIFPAVTGGISNTLLDQVINQPAQAEQPAAQQDQIPETIVTAPKSILPPALSTPELLSAAAAGGALGATALQGAETTQGMTPEETQDVTMTGAKGGGLLGQLTSGMGLTDYLTAASLLGSGISSLFGGGGGSATAVPYVSPFGAGAGFGTGRDYRVSPGITDYERYGFGPEASFFAPEYSQLVSGAAGAPMQTTTGPQASTINPKYVPLI